MGEQLYLERLFWFDAEVRRGRYPNASKLAGKFELCRKTAQRSIVHFRDRLQVPVEYCGTRKGYYYRESYELSMQQLTESELFALLVSKKLLSDAAAGPLGEEISHLADRLGTVLASRLSGSVDPERAFSFRWHGFSPSAPQYFQMVSTALLQNRPLTVCYQSPQQTDCIVRTVEPHHMMNYMGTWYLIAYCRLRHEWRNFQLARMSDCKIEEESFEPRPETEWRPCLEETFGIFQNKERYQVCLRFTPERARWVRGEIWHKDQRTEEGADGALLLTIPVSHPAEILMNILRHGAQVEVLEPEWLQESVRKEIEGMRNIYGRGTLDGEGSAVISL